MVKRILALSLLMVGLVACGSGGGASAEAESLNDGPDPSCQCIVYEQRRVNEFSSNSGWHTASTDLCNTDNLNHSYGCANYDVLCTLIITDWGINNDGVAAIHENNLSNLLVSCN